MEPGFEDRAQAAPDILALQQAAELGVGDGGELRPVGGDLGLDLLEILQPARTRGRGLQGLDPFPADTAHTQGHAMAGEPLVRRIEIGGFQLMPVQTGQARLGFRIDGRVGKLGRSLQQAPQRRSTEDSGSRIRRQEQLKFCFHRHEINEV